MRRLTAAEITIVHYIDIYVLCLIRRACRGGDDEDPGHAGGGLEPPAAEGHHRHQQEQDLVGEKR